MFKVALFDLDGVIFDTEPQYTEFWRSQCLLYHPDQPGLEQRIKGQTLTQIYDKYFDGSLACEREKITRRLDEFEQDMHFDYIAGFEAFIADLRQHGVKTAVVTSSNQKKMDTVYRNHSEFRQMFDAILTAEDFDKSKPDPDCYLKGAQRFGATPDECVVFEDSFNGLKSGRAAEMVVVGLSTTNPENEISKISDIVVNDYKSFKYENICNLITMFR